MHFLYFLLDGNIDIFRKFIISDEDHLISSSTIDDITKHLSESKLNYKYKKKNNNYEFILSEFFFN